MQDNNFKSRILTSSLPVLLIIFLCIVSAGAKLTENPHNKMECKRCHQGEVSFDPGAASKIELIKKDVVSICIECHEEIINVHHPQRVQISEEVPDHFRVGEGNSITCITCHDIHSDDLSMRLLRSSPIGNYASRIDICYECHKDNFKEISPHNSDTEGLSCLICHQNTPTIKDTRETVTLIDSNIERICNFCHIIKTDEHPLNVDTSIKLPDNLPRSDNGKVVCITCHDPHGSIDTINFLRERYVTTLEFGKYENPHNVKEYFNCVKCHLDIPQANDYVDCKFKDDFIMLCYSCHGADREKCHIVNIPIKAGMTLPEKFVLNDDELISCVTCHNPDCSADKRIRYINFSVISKESCNDCHDFSDTKKINPHEESLEKTSDKCYYCHRKDSNMSEFGMNSKFVCLKCHKYKEHPQGGTFNFVMSTKIPGVVLDKKGKITCSTCHDPHKKGEVGAMLKIVDGMTICETCHQ